MGREVCVRVTQHHVSAGGGDSSRPAPSEVRPAEPIAALSYAPPGDRKAQLCRAATVALVLCGTLLVAAPLAAVVWACTAEYYNNTVGLLAPYAWTSVAVGAGMIAGALLRGAKQDPPQP